METQTLIVLAIVATAVAFVARRAWNSLQAARKPKSACTECGCGSTADHGIGSR